MSFLPHLAFLRCITQHPWRLPRRRLLRENFIRGVLGGCAIWVLCCTTIQQLRKQEGRRMGGIDLFQRRTTDNEYDLRNE